MIRVIIILTINIFFIFFTFGCKSAHKPVWVGTIFIENNSSKMLFLDNSPFVSAEFPCPPKKIYYLSTPINISSEVFHKNGTFSIPINVGEKKEFTVISYMPIDYVCKELHIDMETGAVTEDYLGTVSELEFVIFATTEKYSYENYTEYINIIQKYGNEYIGKLMTETEILFFIED